MKIAVLGGGLTGLTAAYLHAKEGNEVSVFEKEEILGGMASGFKADGWNWTLERAYHHIFENDFDIINFAKKNGFNKIFFEDPETASLYKIFNAPRFTAVNGGILRGEQYPIPEKKQNSKIQTPKSKFLLYPLDTPIDFLRFPLLSLLDKIRSGATLAFLKASPFFPFYERATSRQFLMKTMGKETWSVLWEPLFRKKFGKYAGNILASFFWARIKKRTKKLGYIKGGFQTFVDFLERENTRLGTKIRKATPVEKVEKRKDKFRIKGDDFDLVISTLPTPVMAEVTKQIFPSRYIKRLSKVKHLHAVNLILETKEKLLERTYWANIAEEALPFMILVQHTNFIDKKNYGDKHILYVGRYVEERDPLVKMDGEEAFDYYEPFLKSINPTFPSSPYRLYFFKAPFAQPIFDKEFLENKPDFFSPVKNFLIANLDMTYPYDRGTNFAVRLGEEVYRRSLR